MKQHRRITDEELDGIGTAPKPGEVWWCEGVTLGLGDGGKTRPVLVVSVGAGEAEAVALTSQKVAGNGVAIRHRGGTSWMSDERIRLVPTLSLLSSLGAWAGFAAWRSH